MKTTFFTLIFLISLITNSIAQTGEIELYKEYEKVDKELNVVYNKLKSKLNKVEKLALINSQKDWLKFRTSNCKFISREDSEGGVIANKMKIDCETEITRKRIKEIKSLMEDF